MENQRNSQNRPTYLHVVDNVLEKGANCGASLVALHSDIHVLTCMCVFVYVCSNTWGIYCPLPKRRSKTVFSGSKPLQWRSPAVCYAHSSLRKADKYTVKNRLQPYFFTLASQTTISIRQDRKLSTFSIFFGPFTYSWRCFYHSLSTVHFLPALALTAESHRKRRMFVFTLSLRFSFTAQLVFYFSNARKDSHRLSFTDVQALKFDSWSVSSQFDMHK